MKETTEITSAIQALTESATGLRDFYEELYGESIDEFDTSRESLVSVKSDLWRKFTSLQTMADELQSFKTQ